MRKFSKKIVENGKNISTKHPKRGSNSRSLDFSSNKSKLPNINLRVRSQA